MKQNKKQKSFGNNNLKYPLFIEVPDGYWTMDLTINTDKEDVDIYWHHNED